jgi:hypothetical protein
MLVILAAQEVQIGRITVLEVILGKKLIRPHFNSYKTACGGTQPSYVGIINRRIAVQATMGINKRPHLKTT